MDRWFFALLVGLLGGAGGALAVRYLLPAQASGGESAPTDGSLGTTLARIESSRLSLRLRCGSDSK